MLASCGRVYNCRVSDFVETSDSIGVLLYIMKVVQISCFAFFFSPDLAWFIAIILMLSAKVSMNATSFFLQTVTPIIYL